MLAGAAIEIHLPGTNAKLLTKSLNKQQMKNWKTSARTAAQQSSKSPLLFRPAALAAILLLAAVQSCTLTKIAETRPLQNTIERGYWLNINEAPITLANGTYSAWWSAYEMRIIVPGKTIVTVKDLRQGVRGMNVRTNIILKDGYISVVSTE